MKKIQEEMIKEFRKRFTVFDGHQNIVKHVTYSNWVEAFLVIWSEKLLAEQRKEIVKKVEGMKRDWRKQKAENGLMWNDGYNRACDDLIQLIQGEI